MSPEKQRIAIAEVRGYTHVRIVKCIEGPPDHCIGHHSTQPHSVPDYINDLNAMHDVEKNFSASSDQMRYAFNLLNVMKLQVKYEDDDLNVDYCWHACTATAAQRAEAFLKTLNLWEEQP
jgi:hypothetical protein